MTVITRALSLRSQSSFAALGQMARRIQAEGVTAHGSVQDELCGVREDRQEDAQQLTPRVAEATPTRNRRGIFLA